MRARLLERRDGVGIGKLGEKRLIGKLRKARELAPPPVANGLGELWVVIGEEQKRSFARRLLAHENQRYLRTEELQRNGRFQRFWIGQRRQPLAERAVADLIVILQ